MSGHLSRRTVLRGMGTALALPWLEAMLPSSLAAVASGAQQLGSQAGSPPIRAAFLFIPNGVDPPAWMPKTTGPGYVLPPSLEPLAGVRDRFSIVSGLAHRNAQALGDGPGDHARSASCFLTGAHPVKTAGTDINVGMSVDQVLANAIGHQTPLPSLELGCEPAMRSGACDSGYACAYSGNISWRTAQQPNLKEIRPREVFERLFRMGMGRENAAARAHRLKSRRSILDFVSQDSQQLNNRLGRADQNRMDEYFDGVRALERRLEMIERVTLDPEAARELGGITPEDLPRGTPADYREHVAIMSDLMVLAFKLDQTRVTSFMLANEGSNRSFPYIEVSEGHHHLSHHRGDQAMVEKIRRINHFQSGLLANVIKKLDAVQEGDGTLLDHTMLVWGSAISDGNRHNHDHLPVIVAGGSAAGVNLGQHIQVEEGTPMCNLYTGMLGQLTEGQVTEKFGDATGTLVI
jgi:hypothetical protein